MRAALWLIGLFAVAVAAALFAGSNQGSVTLHWPPYRIDFSLNMVVVLLLLAFVLIYGALRGVSAMFELPRQAKRWRVQQKERAMHGAALDAVTQLQAGRFVRARKAALSALAQEQALQDSGAAIPHGLQLRVLGHVLAAESSHALQDQTQRDQHWESAMQEAASAPARNMPELAEGTQLRAAQWALDDHNAHSAIEQLAGLPQGAARRTLALRLKLKAARQLRQALTALDTARLLAKHRAFSAAAAQSIIKGLAMELINDAHDPEQLTQAWRNLDSTERQLPEVGIHAARRLQQLGGSPQQMREWLLPAWERYTNSNNGLPSLQAERLVRVLEDSLGELDASWLARIEVAQQRRPHDAYLQYLAGCACLQRQLWGKAQQWLQQAAPALQEEALRRRAWQHLARQAEFRGDSAAAALAWKQAALAGDLR
ncbi:HemY protein [Comamonas sp. BIGb0152]|uniref:heme biosynthesis HemY N-terminal domain-containing protein n=1 Tax=Comamonas sp. BIGb0152 TaxID=2940601 RepID=UPI00216A4EF4|nr:heme biosynthesis HemY N-terminal domain-containing protein [Comamonas sp. BIGb0152]MCS4295677.1 HemY protein [Comamonas sp. BIGb0152]